MAREAVDGEGDAGDGRAHAAASSSNGPSSAAPAGGLFAGMKFWLSHSVPQRQYLLENAKLHGAEIVPLEKQADVLLVDHARKNQPPGTHSFRFIEESIRKGALANLDDHAIGPASRVQRPVGSTVTAPKKGRTAFTEADDKFLWDHIEPYRRAGGNWKGNEIYKHLEQHNPRHTYQSWRDRFLKHVVYQNRRFPDQQNDTRPELQAPADAVSDAVQARDSGNRPHTSPPPQQQQLPSSSPVPDALTPPSQRTPDTHRDPVVFSPAELGAFSAKDASLLYAATRHIFDCSPEAREMAWANIAESTSHSVDDWKALFNDVILPKYQSRHPQQNMAEEEEEEEAEEGAEEEAEEGDEEDAEGDAEEDAEEEAEEEAVKTCVKCMTTQSHEWHWHRKRSLLCSGCGKLSKNLGVLRPSTSLIEAGTITEPATASARVMVDRASSPIHHPSPGSPKSLPRPEPASPSVRRVCQSDSQHTVGSLTTPVDSDQLSPVKRLRTPPTSLGKRKRLPYDPNIEIPSTPDQEQQESAVLRRRSPRLQSPQSPHRDSPLCISEAENGDRDSDDKHQGYPQLTSPMMVSLVSDAVSRPSPAHNDVSSDVDTASVYHFDTAPDQSTNWDTAPDDRSPDFETAPTSPEDSATLRPQPLIPVIDLTNADFDLPPPVGGWESFDEEELEEPVLAFEGSQYDDPVLDEPNQDEDEYASWKAKHKAAWSGLNQDDVDAILHVAIVATSFDFDTADHVVKAMIEMYRADKSTNHVVLPGNIRGCWTMEDDECLLSDHTRHLKRVRRKHGITSCEERIAFLHDYNQE